MVNTTAAIMALPAPLDPINLVGDEDKHATLLFFGETSTLPADAQSVLADSVKQACEMLVCFSESIRDVSRLGSDNPPALVAMLSDRNLTQVRNLFAMNPAVKGYLDNTPQFPSFTPHVTLGYPDFTEEVILRTLAKQLYRVQFDRLAVWWNDERLEVPLSQLVDGGDMAMSDAIDKFLEHYGTDDGMHAIVEAEDGDAQQHGVKGQKWGVRRPVGSSGLVSRIVGKKADSTPVATGLKPRTGSADQIHQDRIQKKIDTVGVHALSNTEIQSYTRRLQMEKDVKAALAAQSAATQAKADGFIKSFVKKQGNRQADRFVNKALDVAFEAAVKKAGTSLEPTNPALGKGLQEVGKRLAPKKK